MSPRNEFQDIIAGTFFQISINISVCILELFLAGIFASRGIQVLSVLFGYALTGIGISQLMYVVPYVIRLHRRREWGLMKGVIIGAVLTALLNAACYIQFVSR